ncbi:MAG: heme ABC exporter ATP-binding protein CcmA [Chlamydiae bacterium]|nr:heme ABC exporter ATP-binding protein CcmA [Chlamydiota bacterium]
MSPAQIETHQLSKYFGHFPALTNIEIQCLPGERVILLGPNGAGKTTLLKILALLMRPSHGSVSFEGEKVKNPLSIKKKIGYTGHIPHLYQDLTVEENLIFFAKLFELPKPVQIVSKTLDEFSLQDYQKKCVRILSKGMQQRVNLARVFLHQPVLLLLDEPFSNLDSEASHSLLEKLKNHSNQGRSLILATHQTDISESLGSHWVRLEQGRIKEDTDNSSLTPKYDRIL